MDPYYKYLGMLIEPIVDEGHVVWRLVADPNPMPKFHLFRRNPNKQRKSK